MATARILINLYDGTRQLLPPNTEVLLRIRDGDQEEVFSRFVNGPTHFVEVPFHDNLRDHYTVLASSTGYAGAGFFPVKVSPKIIRPVFLMLLPRQSEFNFHDASWDRLRENHSRLIELFSQGAENMASARSRYEDAIEDKPAGVACLLTVLTVMRQVQLPQGTVLDYMRSIFWDDRLQADRFFAYADPEL